MRKKQYRNAHTIYKNKMLYYRFPPPYVTAAGASNAYTAMCRDLRAQNKCDKTPRTHTKQNTTRNEKYS